MKLNLSTLESALNQLKTSMHYYESDLAKQDPQLRAQFRNSAIQCFKFTYGLCYKMIKRQLDQVVGHTEELRQMNFADFIRTAADSNLVPDVKRFLRYRELRNITSHTYNAKNAEEVVAVLPEFIQDVNYLLSELKKRNES